jgi:O-antigen/teichoic acid export membrane protein
LGADPNKWMIRIGAPRGSLAAVLTQVKRFQLKFGRAASWTLVGDLVRLLLTGLTFAVLARVLGPASFGEYSGLLAFVTVLYPLATLGSGHLLIKHVSIEASRFREQWGQTLFLSAIGAAVCVGIALALQPYILPNASRYMLASLAVAELFGAASVELAAFAYLAHGLVRRMTVIRILLAVVRVGALGLFVIVSDEKSADMWVMWHVCGTLIAGAASLAIVSRSLGAPRLVGVPTMKVALSGLPFSFGRSSSHVQDDIDKTMVLRYDSPDVAGFYTAGYRCLNFALLPIRSLLTVTYSAFFRAGAGGLSESKRLSHQLLIPAFLYGLVAGLGFLLLAPLVSHVLGDEYGEAANVIRFLAFLPLLRGIEYFLGDALTGAGYQKLRAFGQVGAACVNVALNIVLIPRFSWQGAAIATLLSEVLLLGTFAIMLRRLSDSPRPNAAGTHGVEAVEQLT